MKLFNNGGRVSGRRQELRTFSLYYSHLTITCLTSYVEVNFTQVKLVCMSNVKLHVSKMIKVSSLDKDDGSAGFKTASDQTTVHSATFGEKQTQHTSTTTSHQLLGTVVGGAMLSARFAASGLDALHSLSPLCTS